MNNIMMNNLGMFHPNPMHDFYKMAIITYNHFSYISIFVHQMDLIFGEKKHCAMGNILTNLQEKMLNGFLKNDLNHLQPICIFLKICDVGISDFGCGYALD